MASISSVITSGFGVPGSAGLVITDGFGTQGVTPPDPEPAEQQFVGGWLSLPDYTRGREEYIRLQRIAMGITQDERPEAAIVIPEAVLQSAKVVALRQRGVRMERREAELRAEVERTQAWKDDYAGVLYAELYRMEKQRRDDDLIVAMLAT